LGERELRPRAQSELSFTLTPATWEQLTEEVNEMWSKKYIHSSGIGKLLRWRIKYFG